ncbi:MAG: hypothetical protein AAF960_22175 [Bacteroidota bacterium]
MSNHNNNNSNLWALAFGIVAGAGATYYLTQTEKGRKMAKKAKKRYTKLEKEARRTIQENANLVSSKANEVFTCIYARHKTVKILPQDYAVKVIKRAVEDGALF